MKKEYCQKKTLCCTKRVFIFLINTLSVHEASQERKTTEIKIYLHHKLR